VEKIYLIVINEVIHGCGYKDYNKAKSSMYSVADKRNHQLIKANGATNCWIGIVVSVGST
jgi:hypothetical protein